MRAELADGRVLEFPDGTDPSVVQATVKRIIAAPQQAQPSESDIAERIAANPATRLITAAGAPFRALFEKIPGSVGENWRAVNTRLAEMEKAGKEQIHPATGITGDVAGIVGNVMSPISLGLMKMLPVATGATGTARIPQVAQNMVTGATGGATFGVMTPTGTTDDPYGEALKQANIGAVTGAIVPGVIEASKAIGAGVRNIFQPMTAKGAEAAAGRLANEVAGSKREDVIKALSTARQGESAGQAAVPTGSTQFVALQRLADKNKPDIQHARNIAEEQIVKREWENLDKLTSPMRDKVLGIADQIGVDTSIPVSKIHSLMNDKRYVGNEFAQSALSKIKESIDNLPTTGQGLVSGTSLYNVRKQMGNQIRKISQDTQTWDKRLTGGLERDVQRAIDDAIESATGNYVPGEWLKYLSTYATEAGKIGSREEASKVAKAMSTKGLEKTRAITRSFEESYKPVGMLDRGVMIANAVIRRIEGGGGQKVMNSMSDLMDNPQTMAKVMKNAKPLERQMLIDAIAQRSMISGLSQQAAQGEQK